MRAGDRPLRLLPWSGPEGKPCYLSGDGTGMLSRLADDMEHTQLAMGEELLHHAREMLADHTVTNHQLHFLASRLREALRDALRVAESRASGCPPRSNTRWTGRRDLAAE
ncbi:hypothetical protein [Streptomyces oceani]|uniref:Uncharacterized protein n=1 Tax=Streptomyces oceani TaxID=1075402 RepID=A0A1E7JZ95_9ACTN|nr:hypothetical protein [Streptomyces oceani]OEU96999.1 hypothetical protein AN216_17155 [Streptomyces oceani]